MLNQVVLEWSFLGSSLFLPMIKVASHSKLALSLLLEVLALSSLINLRAFNHNISILLLLHLIDHIWIPPLVALQILLDWSLRLALLSHRVVERTLDFLCTEPAIQYIIAWLCLVESWRVDHNRLWLNGSTLILHWHLSHR